MRRMLVVLAGIAALSTFVLSQGQSVQALHARSDEFWAFTRLNAQEVEGYSTLESMARAADSVVLGRVVDTGLSRRYESVRGDGTIEVVWYGQVRIQVDEVLHGPSANGAAFEVFLPTSELYDRFRRASLPSERTLFFFRSKLTAALRAGWSQERAATEAPYQMLVNLGQSYFRELDGRVHVPQPGSGDFVDTWEGRFVSDLVEASR